MPAPGARLGVIFFTVFIDLVGFGIVLPILPYYAQSFGARGLLFGALVGAYSGMQFLATAVLGRLSDRVGRRPILLTTMVINAAGYVLFALAGSDRGLRSEEHTSELQSRPQLVCRLLLAKKKKTQLTGYDR